MPQKMWELRKSCDEMTETANNIEKRIVFASLTEGRDQCSIGNAISVAKAQVALLQHPVHLEFRFENDLAAAIDYFHSNRSLDILVAVDNYLSYSVEWITENVLGHPDKALITAVYPLPGVVDWDRVRDRAGDAKEPNGSKGLKYNVNAGEAGCSFTADGKFLEAKSAKLDCLIIKREALDDIVARHPEIVHDGGILAFVESIKNGKKLTRDETFCQLWSKTIYADIEHPAASFGTQVFAGVIGLRNQIR